MSRWRALQFHQHGPRPRFQLLEPHFGKSRWRSSRHFMRLVTATASAGTRRAWPVFATIVEAVVRICWTNAPSRRRRRPGCESTRSRSKRRFRRRHSTRPIAPRRCLVASGGLSIQASGQRTGTALAPVARRAATRRTVPLVLTGSHASAWRPQRGALGRGQRGSESFRNACCSRPRPERAAILQASSYWKPDSRLDRPAAWRRCPRCCAGSVRAAGQRTAHGACRKVPGRVPRPVRHWLGDRHCASFVNRFWRARRRACL